MGPPSQGDAEPLSKALATAAVLKGMIGVGVLGLPYCYGQVGLGLAVPGSAMVALINVFGVLRLIDAKMMLFPPGYHRAASVSSVALAGRSSSNDDLVPGPPELDEQDDFGLGPVGAAAKALFGFPGLVLATFSVLGSQLGCCLAFVDTIQVSLVRQGVTVFLSEEKVRVVVCAVLCAICQVRRLGNLAILSALALLTYLYVLCALVNRGIPSLLDAQAEDPNWATQTAWGPVRWGGFEAFFGTSFFAFEGIILAQYVYDDMCLVDPRPFREVLAVSYGFAYLLFVCVGSFGYMAYGLATCRSTGETGPCVPIYLSFPEEALDTTLVMDVLLLVVVMSFALQMYPVFCFCEAQILARDAEGESSAEVRPSPWRSVINRVVLRSSITTAVCSVAYLLPKVNCVTDLAGNVFMSCAATLLPGLIHMRAALRNGSLSVLGAVANVLLVVIGLWSMSTGFVDAPTCFMPPPPAAASAPKTAFPAQA